MCQADSSRVFVLLDKQRYDGGGDEVIVPDVWMSELRALLHYCPHRSLSATLHPIISTHRQPICSALGGGGAGEGRQTRVALLKFFSLSLSERGDAEDEANVGGRKRESVKNLN